MVVFSVRLLLAAVLILLMLQRTDSQRGRTTLNCAGFKKATSASMSVVHGAVDVGYVYVEQRNRASLMRQLCRVADEELHYRKLLRAGLLR